MSTIVWVALAGGAGALVRFGITLALPRPTPSSFPLAILLVNIAGSFIAGVTLGLRLLDVVSIDVAIVIWAGLCGGLTTFSTFAVETVLLAGQRIRTAWRNVTLTIILSVLAAGVGLFLAQLVLGR